MQGSSSTVKYNLLRKRKNAGRGGEGYYVNSLGGATPGRSNVGKGEKVRNRLIVV